MKLEQLLSPDCTVCAVPGTSKKGVLQQISRIAANAFKTAKEKELLNALIAREKLSSTGIGKGIAIPHGRLLDSQQIIAVLITTETPVSFDAIDDQPVDIFFALFVPEDHCHQHLQTLAAIAAFLGDKDNARRLRKCTNSKQLFELATNQLD
ncbi:PTS IIA-like nitrogen regulatory protein PtsN [Thalassotalea mangrovi]|uniref:PTS IIA-like nitrogen regulatory protein PtsN n=1 Tax=Thalassotalea mangrovi TaxID=2572245 RepID=A0A4U1BAR5_9GAMM|nr:PTS IIA-like nitrogen regulatory protein PtsN [Thalassotalea mangrovi]TKB47887.1 PTS IIA-like nitrogen regulatory protein PtsN [Thalassotalea mangrovi]